MFNILIANEIHKTEVNIRSYAHQVLTAINEQSKYDEVSNIVVEILAAAVSTQLPLLSTVRKISSKVHNILSLDTPKDHSLLSFGIVAVDWGAKAELIDIDKYAVLDDTKTIPTDQWFVVAISQEFYTYAKELRPEKLMYPATQGPTEWYKFYVTDGPHQVPLVKSADRYGLSGLFNRVKMPKVYKAINRLNKQGFSINEYILGLTEELTEQPFGFIPPVISKEQRSIALRSLNDVKRKARYIEEIRFKEMNKWLLEEAEVDDELLAEKISKKRASEYSQDYLDETAEPHQDIISDWSKRMDFEKIRNLAHAWSGSTIHFLFNFCTRGRIYAVQNYLTPLGSDLAKAMLTFDTPIQVSGYDLCIHIANCFGEGKIPFDARVKWVNDNSLDLIAIGLDPVGNYDTILRLGLHKQKKTKWQAIAACREYAMYAEWVNNHGTEDGFLSNLIIGLDATASGTQILTILGRDDKVAPFVNVSASTTGRVGDFYTFLSNYLKPKLEEHRDEYPGLNDILNEWSDYARDLAKRNSMTFSYSGTKWGFGQQQWEDRKDYGPLGAALTRKECRIIGNNMYDVCKENIRGGAEIMDWLREGINYHRDGAVISWTLPDGFTAFQVCDASKTARIEGTIGTRKVSMRYAIFQDKPKISEHKNGISPNYVHSYDAYLLRTIVREMPEEAPISTVHDQFSTTSYYIQELQETAKLAYKSVADRSEAERMANEAFGVMRELPKVGDWTIDNIDEAEFIIC